jgi:hypothetical protein
MRKTLTATSTNLFLTTENTKRREISVFVFVRDTRDIRDFRDIMDETILCLKTYNLNVMSISINVIRVPIRSDGI